MFSSGGSFGLFFIFVLVVGHAGSVSFIRGENLNEGLQVSIPDGIIQGLLARTFSGRQFRSYRGIPYGRPPVRSLRFRPPKPAEPWQGVLDATREGPTCVEIFIRSNGVFTGGTEDCLYINIFTPTEPQSTKELLPVIVWFYGGAFMEGNSTGIMFGPEFLLEEDVVVVSLNYRIGLFGFLSTEDSASPGNYGLKDQNLALRWVKRNIRNFGGDPNRVTIAGQSAGAVSVMYHVASPKSRGLFHRAIANSGTSLSAFGRKREARDIAFKIGSAMGINTENSKELISRMRKMNVQTLNGVSRNLATLGLISLVQQGFPFGPVIEPRHKDAFISESTYALFESGNFNRVPTLMGLTSGESLFFESLIEGVKSLNIIFDLSPGSLPNVAMNIDSFEKRREVGNEIKRYYFKSGTAFDATVKEIEDLVSDDQFVRPIRKTAQLVSRYSPVYYYVFSYRSRYGVRGFDDEEGSTTGGVAHAEDLSYIWKQAIRSPPTDSGDKRIISRMAKFWSNFARTGSPTPRREKLFENTTWPPLDSPESMNYLNIDSTLSLNTNYRDAYMKFWDYLYDKYGGGSYITY